MEERPEAIHLKQDAGLIAGHRRRMRSTPVSLQRPVVVLGGWRSPKLMTWMLAGRLASLTSGNRDDFLRISYPLIGDVERAGRAARDQIVEWLEHRGMDGDQPVDVVAISMGGLVARLLASGSLGGRQIAIERLFTLATPHRGARLARWFRPDRAAAAMQAGSGTLMSLDAAQSDATSRPGEIVCYVQRRDWWVGTWNTSLEGHSLRCVRPRGPISALMSHFTVHQHPAIIVELACRLRGEEGLPCEPSG
ncbi:MAG: hypothetical protein IT435_10090 [Phycisphaerales bacterium]|nr:hypothetical protein [Phycisphaerales bacterium]